MKKTIFAIMILISSSSFADKTEKIAKLLDKAVQIVNEHGDLEGYEESGRYLNYQKSFSRDGETISILDIRTVIEADGTVKENAIKTFGKFELKNLKLIKLGSRRVSDTGKIELRNSEGIPFTCDAIVLRGKNSKAFTFSIPALNFNFSNDHYTVEICDSDKFGEFRDAIESAIKLKNKKPGLFDRL